MQPIAGQARSHRYTTVFMVSGAPVGAGLARDGVSVQQCLEVVVQRLGDLHALLQAALARLEAAL
ncbi:hypothetical protein FW760_25205 [Pseudomonas sp. 1176_21]